MRDSLEKRVSQLNKANSKRRKRKLGLSLLSLAVAVSTLSALLLPAFTLEKIAYCGLEEHKHSEACYEKVLVCPLEEGIAHVHTEDCFRTETVCTCGLEESEGHRHGESCYETERVLVCPLEENEDHHHSDACYELRQRLVCTIPESEGHHHDDSCYTTVTRCICPLEEGEVHVHDESCYEMRLICDKPEHEHTLACYSNPNAVEDEAAWRRTFPVFADETPLERLLAIAASQLGYRESAENYRVLEDGSVQGWTRYGAWYDDPYGTWDAMFVSFCLHYAGIGQDLMPRRQNCAQWVEALRAYQLYAAAAGFEPVPGDLAFYDFNGDSLADHVGLVYRVHTDAGTMEIIDGDAADEVQRRSYLIGDASILGYGLLPEELRGRFSEEAPMLPAEEEACPAQSFKAELNGLTVLAEAGEGAFPPNASMVVRLVPSEQVLDAVNSAVEGKIVWLQAVDISFYNALGFELQPRIPIRVSISSDQIASQESEETEVVHLDAEGEARLLEQTAEPEETAENEVAFEADSFSIFVVVGTTVEKTVLASDGHNYRIAVTFSADSGIPEDADLAVEEIPEDSELYGEYLSKAARSLGVDEGSVRYIRLFDIAITDPDDPDVRYQPAAGHPVDVRIELADKDTGEKAASNTMVVHFADGAESGEVVENLSVDGNVVCFEAEGFSAYAIVEGPDPAMIGWYKISSISELFEKGSEAGGGLYIGHPDGYYYGNTLTGDNSRMGITKTKPAQSSPPAAAARYYFEPVPGTDNQIYAYCYASDGVTKQYVYNGGNNSLSFTDESNKTAFTVSQNGETFTFNNGAWYWNMQGGANGSRFCSWNSANDKNNRTNLWYHIEVTEDPYGLDGKSYGLMNWIGGAAGKALMASSSAAGTLDAKALTVMCTADYSDQLFVPNDSDISMWTFHWIDEDKYTITADVDGATKYLRIDGSGLSLADQADDNCTIQVVPGTGVHAGEICLKSGDSTLTFSGAVADGFSVGGSAGSEWLNLVELSELTSDYIMTYSASKVSVSDPSITNGSRVIVYTRSWNEEKLRYDYYAINHDGTLVPVYESGDSIEWVGPQLNTLLWNFVEYYWEGTTDPNYYYELYNQYSEKFIAPQVTGGQILADDPIGINLNGRRDGQYYSTILAWDDPNYSYVGLKVENGQIVTCPKDEAMDFYFAIMQDLNVDDDLTTVPTVDHTQYGITMKIIDIATRKEMSDYLGNDQGGIGNTLHQGLLSTDLKADGYPTASGGSLSALYGGAQEVNHLFIQSTYSETGYFEYDSSQNFASLKGQTGGNFTVYKELGTYDSLDRPSLKHGQFFPFNDLKPGLFASVNGKNLYSSTVDELSDGDPRKYEQIYNIEHDGKKVDCYFAVELEASFTQTPSGLDAWGHDIIFEFTGDDDFWLYVDGELVIDLGGIHSAVPGSVNFRTGEVHVNGTDTTLRDLFYNNYKGRGHTDAEAQAYVDRIFEQNDAGQWVFKDDTTHKMNVFYMERGAGASNLKMRFNLAAVKEGTVQLSKKLAGVDESNIMAEFPYQIWYKTNEDEEEHLLTNALPHSSTQNTDYVFYKDTINPVKYQQAVTIDGTAYQDVFFLKPDETADINFPEGMTSYRIVECGVNTDVFSGVTVNNEPITGTAVSGTDNREDFGIDYATTDARPKVNYVNTVNPNALRTLTIKKQLFREDGETEISAEEDDTEFSFRLYLASEYDDNLDVTNMQTYHVKDPDGNYCRWDAANQEFVTIGEGIRDYAQLTDEQKAAASFTTSIYGSIGKIRAGYTVEVRELLPGTKFRVVERPTEIPDGYSFQKYIYNDTDSSNSAAAGISDTITAGADPDVVVCNLKGWGLRMNKVWTDADYMSSRDPAYFAVYTRKTGNGGEHGQGYGLEDYVPGSLRELPYGTTSLYWYWLMLPVEDVPFDHYMIREVEITSGTPIVDSEGVVTNATDLVFQWRRDGDSLTLAGTQKGETESAFYPYTVHYDQEEALEGSNVRVTTVTNDRPGIILKKQDWDGHPLAGATFTLKETDSDTLIGTFTSDEEGMLTTAFLGENKSYTLTETNSPQGYHGLETEMTIIRNADGTVTVSGPGQEYYVLTQAQGTTLATLILKNRPYTFQAVKQDEDTSEPMAGVTFALHKQKTVDGVTAIDLNPEPGYENLITDANGVIPLIDNTLPPGTYELREKATLEGYEPLSAYIQFTVSDTGEITLGSHPVGVDLAESEENGSLAYVLTILNSQRRKLSFKKVDSANVNTPLQGAVFDLYQGTGEDKTRLYSGLTSGADGLLADQQGQTVFVLPPGQYTLIETAAPPGYNLRASPVIITIGGDAGVTYNEGTNLSASGGVSYDDNTKVYTLKISNTTGFELPSTGGAGTLPFRLGGAALILTGLLFRFRRRRRERGRAMV